MPLHGLTHVVIGVPNVVETAAYYEEFGLAPDATAEAASFSTLDGGQQLSLVPAATRRLVELGVAADDVDDLALISGRLSTIGLPVVEHTPGEILAHEPVARFAVRIRIAERVVQEPAVRTPYNGPGRADRAGRAPGILRQERVRPRKLGHAVVGTTHLESTMRFFVEGLGFKVSDYIGDKGAFMRCSTDHHNVLALAAPVNFLHHTSWQVDDVDDVGRGATTMLEDHPERHVWGLGRHHAGSNFFWYLKDPAGNFCEYYSDMDCVPEDALWTPEAVEGAKGLYGWGPPPPPSFLAPEDLAALMTGAHSPG
ncbi:VOC family protein [Streptomyces mirabilis]|uniref:VOC family protein n=1 Tax=Streptomyces mirabilis TaxID=68239 RepID=UPI003686C06F